MSIQGEEIGKNKLYTQSGKGEYKRKEMTGKTAQMINNLRQRKKWRKQTWRIKTEIESRWKEIEGKSRDVFQCFNAGKKYVGNHKKGKETSSPKGTLPASTRETASAWTALGPSTQRARKESAVLSKHSSSSWLPAFSASDFNRPWSKWSSQILYQRFLCDANGSWCRYHETSHRRELKLVREGYISHLGR